MFNQSSNPQVTYSLTELSRALYRLMEQKRFQDITVTELCGQAQIARRTYYRNCEAMEDLVDYAICQQVQQLLDMVDFTCKDAELLYQNFFRFWFDRRVFLTTTFSQGFFSQFYRQFTRFCADAMDYPFLTDFLKGQKDQARLRLFHNAFIIGGLCNVLEHWTAEEFRTPIPALVSILTAFVPASACE